MQNVLPVQLCASAFHTSTKYVLRCDWFLGDHTEVAVTLMAKAGRGESFSAVIPPYTLTHIHTQQWSHPSGGCPVGIWG